MNAWRLLVVLAAAAPGLRVKIEKGEIVSPQCDGPAYAIVRLWNAGPPRTCEVRASAGKRGVARWIRTVSLPTGARKRVFVYFWPLAGVEVEARIAGSDRVLVRKRMGTLSCLSGRAVCVIGRPVGLEDYFSSLRKTTWWVVRMNPARAPDRWFGYRTFEAVIVSPRAVSAMSVSQQRALWRWAQAGGVVAAGGGVRSALYRSTLLAGLCPFSQVSLYEGSDEGAIAVWCGARKRRFDRLMLAGGRLQFGRVRLAADSRPLVVERRVGLGRVVFFAFDPTEAAFRRWKDGPLFLCKALRLNLWRWREGADECITLLYGDLQARPGVSLLEAAGLAGMLLTYAVLIGPVTRRLVERRGLYAWRWAILLGWAAAFTVLAYAAQRATPSTKSRLHAVSVIDIPRDFSVARGRQVGSVWRFAPGRYELFLPMPRLAWRPASEYYLDMSERMEFHLEERRPRLVIPAQHPSEHMWVAEWLDVLDGGAGLAGLRAAVRYAGGRLEDAYVLTSRSLRYVGDVTEETLAAPLAPKRGREWRAFQNLSREALRKGQRLMVASERDRLRWKVLQMAFGDEVAKKDWRGVWGAYPARVLEWNVADEVDAGQAYLVGWAPGQRFAPWWRGRMPKGRRLALVRIQLPSGCFEQP